MRKQIDNSYFWEDYNMSKMCKAVKRSYYDEKVLRRNETVKNYMGGDSYVILNPIEKLKMIAASSIFGEPSYYKDASTPVRKTLAASEERNSDFVDQFYLNNWKEYEYCSTSSHVFETVINEALSYDFHATLLLAIELRTRYLMRLNPQIIMVIAANHPKRKEFTKEHPGEFDRINQIVMSRADDPLIQLTYYIYSNKGKENIPSILKRSISKKLSSLNPYMVNKYKNAEIGMINGVRITHANSETINLLMKNELVVEEKDNTWQKLKSEGCSWVEILSKINLGHMALLRNIYSIYIDFVNEKKYIEFDAVLDTLKRGVKNGKQFPFRYYTAYKTIQARAESDRNSIPYDTGYVKILDTLEECMDISIENLPHLKGKTACLSDNSGSAWSGFTSEYGTTSIAEIDNLSSIIAARCSDNGTVFTFGDRVISHPISKRKGILDLENTINKSKDTVGLATEGGIWKFFYNVIKNKIVYDNIFIFSDQQAGTGRLYGNYEQLIVYKNMGYAYAAPYVSHECINVYKLILDYRKQVNPKVNVFSIQTAGYDNNILPTMCYRTALLTGWTGKEVLFAKEYIDQWDEIENKNNSKK